MLTMPQIHGAGEDGLDPDEVAVCKEECTPRGQNPWDETVFELCVLTKMIGILLKMHIMQLNCTLA